MHIALDICAQFYYNNENRSTAGMLLDGVRTMKGKRTEDQRWSSLSADELVEALKAAEQAQLELAAKFQELEERSRVITEKAFAGIITEREQASEQFWSLFEHAPVGIYRITPDGTILMANPAFVRMLGYGSFEELPKSLDAVGYNPSSSWDEFRMLIELEGKVVGHESSWQRKDGSALDVREYARVVEGSDGEPLFYEGMIEDITKQKEAQAQYETSEERYHELVEKANIAILTDDPEGNITYFNNRFAELFGYSVAEMRGQTLQTIIHPDNAEQVLEIHAARSQGREAPSRYEFKAVRKDGTPIYLEADVVEIKQGDTIVGSHSYIWDITERKKAEIQLKQNFGELEKNGENQSVWLSTANDLLKQQIARRKRAEQELKKSYGQLREVLTETVLAMGNIVEARDPYTAGHQQRVTRLACAIAEQLGMTEEQIAGIGIAGLLHDIGKIMVPAEILNKPGRLDEMEFKLIKAHPQVGFDILKNIDFPWPIAQMVLQHHERMDGSGYPNGLPGDQILLEARILAIADVVESMSSHRPYRPSLGIDAALKEIIDKKESRYDPLAVDMCIRLFAEKNFEFEGKEHEA
jgi:PAS domain S-box-containing protein/putative nucleotidyltransferase with HDIG domain